MTTENDNSWQAKPHYGYSGKSVITALAGSLIIALILSFIYGPLENWSPLIYLNLALAVGLAWGVSWGVRKMLWRNQICDVKPAITIGFITGMAAAWFSWLAYIWTLAEYDFNVCLELVAHPLDLIEIMEYLANNPRWNIGKSADAMPAIVYYGIWLVEFLVIVGIPTVRARELVTENRVCDKCRDWLRPTGDVALFALPEDVFGFKQSVENGDLSSLPLLPRKRVDKDSPDDWIEVVGSACANCDDQDSAVTVKTVAMEKNKDDKLVRRETVVARHVPVSVEMEKQLFDPPSIAADGDAAGASEIGEDGVERF